MKNSILITTKFIMKFNKPILHVIHDSDGDWQFLGDQDITESDALVVSFENILKIDESIKEIIELPIGYQAIRKNKSDIWKITQL